MLRNRFLMLAATIVLSLIEVPQVLSQLAPSVDPSWQRYQGLLQIADLELKPGEPFILKLDYQLYDLEGNPTVKGTVEKVWGQTANQHTTIHSSTLQMNDADPEGLLLLHHDRESYLVHQLVNSIVHPLPYSTRRLDFILKRSHRAVNGIDLSCLSIGRAGQEQPRTQNFCTDVDGLLQTIDGDGPFVIERSSFMTYRDIKVPADIAITYRGKPAIKAHVTELSALNPVEGQAVADEAPIVPGQPLTQANPSYPMGAKLGGASGLVLLSVLVTKDGHVTGVDVISSPNGALSKAAIEAVKKWTYSPYKRNGQPVDAEETVTVDFTLTGN
jgi:TonB family protein